MPIQNRRLILASVLIAVLLVSPRDCSASEDWKKYPLTQTRFPSRPQRTLKFPETHTVGEIRIGPIEPGQRKIELQGAAKGTVVVPANKYVTLIASPRFFTEPTFIYTIPPDGIDCLMLNAMSFADSEDGLCDRALTFVGHLKGLVELNLDRSDSSDTGMAHIGELPNLQTLSSFSSNCSGTALKQICNCKKLRILRLPYNPIKEENLQYLGGMPQLEVLNLDRTGLSDAGMKYVAKCTNLRMLGVAKNAKVGDQSLNYLVTLKKLQYLDLRGTSVSVAGLLKVQKGLSLLSLFLPRPDYSAKDMDALAKAFPGVDMSGMGKRRVDNDTSTLFAPLH